MPPSPTGRETKPRGKDRVYIKAHQDVTYGTVYPVLEYLNKQQDLHLEAIDLAVAEGTKE